MTLSYLNIFSDSKRPTRVKAHITTNHSASSYGQPVIVLEDGEALDLMSWVGCNYRVIRATDKERELLGIMGLI